MSERPDPASETSGPLGTGWVVFIGLAILTIAEYFLAIGIDKNVPILVVFAIAKAGLIMHYFMHLLRIWHTDEEDS